MLQFDDEHGGHAVNGRAAFGLDGFERGGNVERFPRKDHRGAADGRTHRAQHAAETMIQRHRNADPVALAEPLTFGRIKRVQQQIAVTEQGALGQAGRPGRVLQD